MDIVIETATANLLDELCEIEKQSFTSEAFTRQQILYLLKENNSIGLVAKMKNKTAGFLIGKMYLEKRKTFGHLLTLDVAPTYRRMGIAQTLLERFEEILGRNGAVECSLEVRESNSAAISLYSKLGYERMKRLHGYYGNAHGIYMRKKLKSG